MLLEMLNLDLNTLVLWAGLGLGTGLIAKYLVPGRDPGGLLTTALTGIIGAFVGGALASHFGISTSVGSFSPLSLVAAVLGAMVVLVALRILKILI